MGSVATFSKLWQRISPWLLGFSWLLGMTWGCISCESSREISAVLIHHSVDAVPSFVGALSVVILPFLLSAFAVSICEPWLLLIISTFKAFSFSFCAWGVCLAFGQSSWLVLFLFLFSDFCLVPALYFYWLRSIRNGRIDRWERRICILYLSIVFAMDYWVIGPFLRKIIE